MFDNLPDWALPMLALLAIYAAMNAFFSTWGDWLAKRWPGYKLLIVSVGLRGFGVLAAMEPQLFAPFFGNEPWAGLAVFFVGQVIAGLRSVTAVPGDNLSPELRAAVALHTLVRKDPEAVAKGAEYLASREDAQHKKQVATLAKAAERVVKPKAGK